MKQLINPEDLQFLFREKNNNGGEFTVKSLKTGKDYTFKVSRKEFNDKWYTHVKVEVEYDNFKRLGTFYPSKGKIYHKGSEIKTPAAEAAAWLLRQIHGKKYSLVKDNVEIMHTGSCLVCGKKLTDAESIDRGIGPICRGN